MPQTHYIEIDEEIISAVGRLRKSGEGDNVFVFPKRALILQSIVNLKLLEREAKKLNKKIIVVTQDNEGKMLAEKAGLATQQYNEDTMQASAPQMARFTVHHGESIPMPSRENPLPAQAPRSTAIGSADFYNGVPKAPVRQKTEQPADGIRREGVPLRIRNANPSGLTSLNSLRIEEGEALRQSLTRVEREPNRERFTPPVPPRNEASSFSRERQEKLHRFLSGRREDPQMTPEREVPRVLPPRPPAPVAPLPPTSSLAPWAFIILGCLSAVAIVGAAVFIFLPKASVFLVAQGATESFKYQFIGTKEAPREGETAISIPARMVEMEKVIALTIDATGEEGSGTAKARGTVVIYNDFSSTPQPLVATTRVATADGLVYRLVSGVTVPGVIEENGQRKPGAIEVSVVADQGGEKYNIGPSEFKIPGFQGTAKYDKFTAKSTKSITGGGGGTTGGGSKTVALADLDGAAKKAEGEARTNFLDETHPTLQPGEKLLEDSIEMTSVGTASAPAVGVVATTFDYQARYKVRGFVISEESLRNFVDKQTITSNQADSVILKPVGYELTYGKPLPNFTEGKVEFSLEAKMTLRAPIDTEALRTELLGQDEDGIRSVLEKHPEVKRLRVEFKPKIFVASIPKNPDRVTIVVSDEE